MSTYRLVVRHVRYWRGAIHRWSTVYHYTGSSVTWSNAFLQTMATQDGKMCYGPTGDGGIYQVEVYNQAAGGAPLLTLNLFDPTAPGSWPGYSGTAYTSTGLSFLTTAEPALQVFWTAGVSKSGKATYLRKWYHSVPVPPTGSGSSSDVRSADLTALTTAANGFQGLFSQQGLNMSTPGGGTLAGAATVRSFYGAHQMPRGRRVSAKTSSKGLAHKLENVLGNLPRIAINTGEDAE